MDLNVIHSLFTVSEAQIASNVLKKVLHQKHSVHIDRLLKLEINLKFVAA